MASHIAVARAWAKQTGKDKRGFNMFYDGLTIYSYGYHHAIAKLVRDNHGDMRVLVNAHSPSTSTAKHTTFTRRAVHSLDQFVVPYVDLDHHDDNHAYLVAKIAEYEDKAKRARTYKDMWLKQAHVAQWTADAYAERFMSLPAQKAA